jgi:hypothetical protein
MAMQEVGLAYVDMGNGVEVSKVSRYKWRMQNAPCSLEWVDKNDLSVDDTYQRALRVPKCVAIARDWSWIACAALTVANRDGSYKIVDGQHRWQAAMRRSDITVLPCLVFPTCEVKEEAAGFLASNVNRGPLSGLARFKAAVVTGADSTVIANNLIRSTGRTISTYTGPGTISCVGTLVKLSKSTPQVLQRVWPLITDICEGSILSSRVVEGVVYIESRLPKGTSLTDQKLYDKLAGAGYATIQSSITKACLFYVKGGPKVYASAILEVLNKGLRNRIELSG